jgi:hypothetical protein
MRAGCLFLVVLLMVPAGSRAEDEAPDAAWTPEARDQAIKRGFAFLDDHLWKMGDGGSPEKQYAIAVTGWASLLSGKAEGEGRKLPSRARELKRFRTYLEGYVKRVSRLYDEDRKQPDDLPGPDGMPMSMARMSSGQFCWPLSMTAFFLAESAARGKDKRSSKRVLKQIVEILESAQQPDGGWGHDDARIPGFGLPKIPLPKPGGGTKSLEYPHTLLAASNCVGAALGTSKRALKQEPGEVAEKAIAYFRAAQSSSGMFPYDPSQKTSLPASAMRGAQGAFTISRARTAGALLAIHALGVKPDDEMARLATAVLDEALEDVSEGHGSAMMALQLGALLQRARGDEAWAKFRAIYFPRILAAQAEDGSFSCVCKGEAPGVTCDSSTPGGMNLPGYLEGKKSYVTSILVLVLLLDRATLESVAPVAKPGPVTKR